MKDLSFLDQLKRTYNINIVYKEMKGFQNACSLYTIHYLCYIFNIPFDLEDIIKSIDYTSKGAYVSKVETWILENIPQAKIYTPMTKIDKVYDFYKNNHVLVIFYNGHIDIIESVTPMNDTFIIKNLFYGSHLLNFNKSAMEDGMLLRNIVILPFNKINNDNNT